MALTRTLFRNGKLYYYDPPGPPPPERDASGWIRRHQTYTITTGWEEVNEILYMDYIWTHTWGVAGTGERGHWVKVEKPVYHKVKKPINQQQTVYWYEPPGGGGASAGTVVERTVESGYGGSSVYATSEASSSGGGGYVEVKSNSGGDPLNIAESKETQKATTGGNPLNLPSTGSGSSSEPLSIITSGVDDKKPKTLTLKSGDDSNVRFDIQGGDKASIALSVYYAD